GDGSHGFAARAWAGRGSGHDRVVMRRAHVLHAERLAVLQLEVVLRGCRREPERAPHGEKTGRRAAVSLLLHRFPTVRQMGKVPGPGDPSPPKTRLPSFANLVPLRI